MDRRLLEAADMAAASAVPAVRRISPGPGAGGAAGFTCPNCSKSFAREDLLRRHLTREQRSRNNPKLPRQKACQECSKSKARCDLDYPCSRCRKKGKECVCLSSRSRYP